MKRKKSKIETSRLGIKINKLMDKRRLKEEKVKLNSVPMGKFPINNISKKLI